MSLVAAATQSRQLEPHQEPWVEGLGFRGLGLRVQAKVPLKGTIRVPLRDL